MDISLLKFEIGFRVTIFFSAFVIFIFCEFLFPRRALIVPRLKRWFSNLSIIFINNLILWLLFPGALVGISIYAQNNHIGLLNHIDTPIIFDIFFSLLCLDLAIYSQHIAFHKFNILW